jgi:hypothetical protein
MEFNKNNKSYGEGEQQQLRGSPRKRKFNELAKDGHGQPATVGEQQQQQPPVNLSKKHCCGQQGDDDLEVCTRTFILNQFCSNPLKNVHLESLTQEELIQLVQKQHEQLEAVKKAAEEENANAKQQAKEIAAKMEELNKALLASQQKVEELTEEMANQNVEHQQKHLDSAKQAEV